MDRERTNQENRTGSTGSAGASSPSSSSSASSSAGERERSVPTSRERGEQGGQHPRGRRRGALRPSGAFAGPFGLMQQFQDEVDRLFQDFGMGRGPSGRESGRGMRRAGGAMGAQIWNPEVDVFRRGEEIVVRADLPGLRREDVSVELEEGVLTIRGERREEQEEDREGYYWSERNYGSFERAIPLPDGVNEDQAQARFQDGVLEVTMPAPQEQEARKRTIEVK